MYAYISVKNGDKKHNSCFLSSKWNHDFKLNFSYCLGNMVKVTVTGFHF